MKPGLSKNAAAAAIEDGCATPAASGVSVVAAGQMIGPLGWIWGAGVAVAVAAAAAIAAGAFGKIALGVALLGIVANDHCLARVQAGAAADRSAMAGLHGFRFALAEVASVCLLVLSLGLSPVLRTDIACIGLLAYLVGLLCPLIHFNAVKQKSYREHCRRVGVLARGSCFVMMLLAILISELPTVTVLAGRGFGLIDLEVAVAAFAVVLVCIVRALRDGVALAGIDPSPAAAARKAAAAPAPQPKVVAPSPASEWGGRVAQPVWVQRTASPQRTVASSFGGEPGLVREPSK